MHPQDIQKLAVQFTKAIKAGKDDNVWIEYIGPKAQVFAEACAARVHDIGGNPFLLDSGSAAMNQKIGAMSDAQIAELGEEYLVKMKEMQGYIRI